MKKIIIALVVAALAAVGIVFALNSANAKPASTVKAAVSTSNDCSGSTQYVPCVNTSTTVSAVKGTKGNWNVTVTVAPAAGTGNPAGSVSLACHDAKKAVAPTQTFTFTGASASTHVFAVNFSSNNQTWTCTASFTGATGSLWNSSVGTSTSST